MKIKNLTGEDVYLLDTFEKQVVKIPVEHITLAAMNILLETVEGIRFRANCSNRFESKVLKNGPIEPLPSSEKGTVFLLTPDVFGIVNTCEEGHSRKDICTYSTLSTLESDGKLVYKELIFN